MSIAWARVLTVLALILALYLLLLHHSTSTADGVCHIVLVGVLAVLLLLTVL